MIKFTKKLIQELYTKAEQKSKLLFATFVLVLISIASNAQNKTVTGRVTDENGVGLGAATIAAGTQKVKTNSDGTFSIDVPNDTKTLTVSYVGYAKQVLRIAANNTANAVLQAVKKTEDEVVVTGIKTVKKTEFAGAVSSIGSKTIKDRPFGSFDQGLQGQISGVSVLTSSGQPGSSANIIIRGTSSIAGTSSPLYVVDGIPVEAGVFQAINSNDIQTIDVYKDASAAALYGSRGSAGVIVVTTKRGIAQKMKVSYSGQVGFKGKPQVAFKPMTTAQLLKAQEDYGKVLGTAGSAANPGWYYSKLNPRYAGLGTTGQATADYLLDSISKINTNWDDYMFRTGTFSNHQISISGGEGRTRVYSSLELYNEQGVTPRTDMKRATLRNNIDYADDRLTLGLSTALSYVRRNFQQSTTTNSTGNPFLAKNIASPYSLVYKPDGTYATGTGVPFVGANQLDLNSLDQNYNNQIKALFSLTTSYKLTKTLKASLTTGVDYRETQNTNYGSKLAYSRTISATPTVKSGFQTEGMGRFFEGTVRPSLSYINTFANKHKVDLSVFGEYIQQNVKSLGMTGYGIDPRTPGTPAAITQGDGTNLLFANLSGGKSANALASGLVIGTYTYNDKLSFTGSFRSDGSSKLPSANRWQNFYSIGGVWTVSKAKFLENSKFVNNLRLRASYGGAGNNDNFPFGDFGYLTTYAASGTYSGLTTLYANNIGNPDLRWEKVYTTNVGTDFTLLKSRIWGSIDVYNKQTKDLFVTKPLTAEAGGGSILVNAGKLENKGVEVELNYDIIKTKYLVWTINGNVAYNRNKVLSLGGQQSYTSGTALITEGLPLGTHNEVGWAGVDAATGAPLYLKKDGSVTNVYPADDKVQKWGTYEAPWKGGFGTGVKYKAFDFSVLFSWQRGATKVDNLEYFVENPGGFLSGGYNQSQSLNFWKQPGDIASTPSPLYSTNFSSKIIHDASFLRLRDVMLGYTIPQNITKKLKYVSKANFYVQGSNLFMWTHWRGMDPEAGPSNINLSEFPNPRSITAGFNVTF